MADLYATSWRLIGWQHAVYFFTGWSIALGWIAVSTFDSCCRSIRPRPSHPISAPLAGFSSGWLASYSLTNFKIVMTALRRAFGGDWAPARYPFVWVCAVFLFPVACLQTYSLNVTMGQGGTTRCSNNPRALPATTGDAARPSQPCAAQASTT